MRFALGIEYQGERYSGWQRQNHVNSVQQEIEKVLSKISDHPVEIFCAGRTDAGVHATGQVIHFDTHNPRDLKASMHSAQTHNCLMTSPSALRRWSMKTSTLVLVQRQDAIVMSF